MSSPSFWEPKGSRKVVFNPKDWHSTYSDLGKWFLVPYTAGAVAATGIYVPGEASGHERHKRKVALTKKAAAMNKSGKHRRAEMAEAPGTHCRPPKHDIRGELATPPRDTRGKALTHKLWAKEYLVSTNQADLTDISQHAMCGVTNELFKPGADPRRVVKLAEQLRSIANRRAEEGLIDEARVALKQAKAMTESCITAIQRGADLRQTVGYREVAIAINTPKSARAAPEPKGTSGAQGIRSVEHEANELLIRITCDTVALSSKRGKGSGAIDSQVQSDQIMAMSERNISGRREMGRIQTDRSGAASAPLPSITIAPISPSQSPGSKILPWAAASAVGATSMAYISPRPKAPQDFLCGQIASSPIAGYPDSNRYMTSQQKAVLLLSNKQLRKENEALRVTRKGRYWTPLPSQRAKTSDEPNDLRTHITRQNLARQLSDATAHTTLSVTFPSSSKGTKGTLSIEEALGNKKTKPLEQENANSLPETVLTKVDGW